MKKVGQDDRVLLGAVTFGIGALFPSRHSVGAKVLSAIQQKLIDQPANQEVIIGIAPFAPYGPNLVNALSPIFR
jgi:hypothetical protein